MSTNLLIGVVALIITAVPIAFALMPSKRRLSASDDGVVMDRVEAPLADAILNHLDDQGEAGSSVFATAQALNALPVVSQFSPTERLQKIREELEWLEREEFVYCLQRDDNPNLSVYAPEKDPED